MLIRPIAKLTCSRSHRMMPATTICVNKRSVRTPKMAMARFKATEETIQIYCVVSIYTCGHRSTTRKKMSEKMSDIFQHTDAWVEPEP